MKHTIYSIPGHYDGELFYNTPRTIWLGGDDLVMITGKMHVDKCDLPETAEITHSTDGGKTWGAFSYIDELAPKLCEDGIIRTPCDIAPFRHSSGRHFAFFCLQPSLPDGKAPMQDTEIPTVFGEYDAASGKFGELYPLDIPKGDWQTLTAGGGGQCAAEDENGDILIACNLARAPGKEYGSVAFDPRLFYVCVMRFRVEGKHLRYMEAGDQMTVNVGRGLYEPSLYHFGGRYYLTLRNDEHGYIAVSDDGLHFNEPQVWKWDSGEILPNYNTQQHFLECGGKLYLVYTRKAGNNDHVFRHRAPLFMAEIDTENLCIRRHTEVIAAPERGARLGNFGVTQMGKDKAVITVAEWMQPKGCERFGSDNTIWSTVAEAD